MIDEWKEDVRRRYSAHLRTVSHIEVEQATGITAYKLRTFASKGYMNKPDTRRLAEYLDSLDAPVVVAKEDAAEYTPNGDEPSAILLMAQELENLAAYLRSPTFSDKAKGEKMLAFIDAFQAAREEYKKLFTTPQEPPKE